MSTLFTGPKLLNKTRYTYCEPSPHWTWIHRGEFNGLKRVIRSGEQVPIRSLSGPHEHYEHELGVGNSQTKSFRPSTRTRGHKKVKDTHLHSSKGTIRRRSLLRPSRRGGNTTMGFDRISEVGTPLRYTTPSSLLWWKVSHISHRFLSDLGTIISSLLNPGKWKC